MSSLHKTIVSDNLLLAIQIAEEQEKVDTHEDDQLAVLSPALEALLALIERAQLTLDQVQSVG